MGQSEFYAVLDIGGTKIRAGLWDGSHLNSVLDFETPKVSAHEFIEILVKHINQAQGKNQVKALGVSTAGPVDVVHGQVLNPVNLGNGDDSWLRLELKKSLSAKLSIPVVVDNDAAMTAYGQIRHFESAQIKDLVVVTLGTGLGVGAVINSELVRAGQNMHPELGHFIISDQQDHNYPTDFDNYPTMESYLSGFHFSKRVGLAMGQNFSGAELIRLSEEQSPQVLSHWRQYSRHMAITLSNLYLAYFPQKFVLAGGFAMVAAPYFLSSTVHHLQQILKARTEAGMPLPSVEISAHHDELPLIGAGYRAQEMGL